MAARLLASPTARHRPSFFTPAGTHVEGVFPRICVSKEGAESSSDGFRPSSPSWRSKAFGRPRSRSLSRSLKSPDDRCLITCNLKPALGHRQRCATSLPMDRHVKAEPRKRPESNQCATRWPPGREGLLTTMGLKPNGGAMRRVRDCRQRSRHGMGGRWRPHRRALPGTAATGARRSRDAGSRRFRPRPGWDSLKPPGEAHPFRSSSRTTASASRLERVIRCRSQCPLRPPISRSSAAHR